jgi:hypothetical protein
MSKRPKISDNIYDRVRELHEESTGDPAGGFEEALRTVVNIANAADPENNRFLSDWYPGKYAGEFIDRVSGRQSGGAAPDKAAYAEPGPTTQEITSFHIDPASQAVFKTTLDDGHRINIPDPEIVAHGLEPGELLQVIAYSVSED